MTEFVFDADHPETRKLIEEHIDMRLHDVYVLAKLDRLR